MEEIRSRIRLGEKTKQIEVPDSFSTKEENDELKKVDLNVQEEEKIELGLEEFEADMSNPTKLSNLAPMQTMSEIDSENRKILSPVEFLGSQVETGSSPSSIDTVNQVHFLRYALIIGVQKDRLKKNRFLQMEEKNDENSLSESQPLDLLENNQNFGDIENLSQAETLGGPVQSEILPLRTSSPIDNEMDQVCFLIFAFGITINFLLRKTVEKRTLSFRWKRKT